MNLHQAWQMGAAFWKTIHGGHYRFFAFEYADLVADDPENHPILLPLF